MYPYESSACSRFGASMGRKSDRPELLIGRCHLRRVPACDGGDYDPGGAYWGGIHTSPLYCAWGYDAEGYERICYVRAPSREAAKRMFPNAKFYR